MAETHTIWQTILQTDWKNNISPDITLRFMNSWFFGGFFGYEHIFIEGIVYIVLNLFLLNNL